MMQGKRSTGVRNTRRQVLRWAAGCGSAAGLGAGWLPLAAQTQGTLDLLRAPRVALVVGNGQYVNAPVLKNAPHDARGMARALAGLGFAVTRRIDVNRRDLLAAIRDFAQTVEAARCVALFYFAGHGLQIAWHNYLLPVDAEIDKADDVAKQSVDVDSLLKRLAKAGNAMNLIILDACRENPFARDFRGRGQGLSQMDAPRNTLLAYATSPGNVAADGGGDNGLYTEQLLRELQVPEAKIEEVFKRVRLAVRLKSAGAQVPWESTSLEEDFWFRPPPRLSTPSEEDKQRRFRDELALWERIRASRDAAPLEGYLRRYPSGHFSELAQLQLDRALERGGEKRVAIAPAEGNPFTRGSASADTAYRVGDSYTYRVLDLDSRAERRRVTATVTEITDGEVRFGNGLVTDLLGNTLRSGDGRRFSPRQQFPLEYAIGRQWHSRYTASTRKGDDEGIAEFDLKIVARERITVPAGSFDAFRIEATGTTQFKTYRTTSRVTRWMAPDRVRRAIAAEETLRRGSEVLISERQELLSFTQG